MHDDFHRSESTGWRRAAVRRLSIPATVLVQ